MSELLVRPSYVLTENEILTCDKLNLMATPVVELSITDPVNDQNFFRNGNFYSSFWVTPAGMSHAPAVTSSNANYWSIEPQGAAVVTKRSTLVPDTKSLFSNEIDGANSVTDCLVRPEYQRRLERDPASKLHLLGVHLQFHRTDFESETGHRYGRRFQQFHPHYSARLCRPANLCGQLVDIC